MAHDRERVNRVLTSLNHGQLVSSTSASDYHAQHSVLRERIVEHLFVADVLQRLWQMKVRDVELLRSEIDAGGYDLVFGSRTGLRYVQLKATLSGGATRKVKVNLKLAGRPGGCVIWILIADDLNFQGFRWLGGDPGEPLPPIDGLKVARHSKGNSLGEKAERPGQRVVPKSRFQTIPDLDALLLKLFGERGLEPSDR